MPAADRKTREQTAGPQRDQRLELYVRDAFPTALAESIKSVHDRLEHLEEAGDIVDYRLEQWPSTINTGDDLADNRLTYRNRVTAFREWAAEHGYTLEPAFQTRTVTSSILDRDVSAERISVPLFTLAVYEDDQLSGVAPCSDDTGTYTVTDCLASLETDGAVPFVGDTQSPLPETGVTEE
jgi:hypothetical protein